MYGLFIMNKRKEWDIPTIPVLLSEWIDMKPAEVDRSLHAATDWFAVQKGSTQNYAEAIKKGHFKTKLTNEWKRMNAMDLTDIYYDNFLLNGKNQTEQPQFKAGDKVRLRIANGGASDYFWLSYAGGKITVVATDGNGFRLFQPLLRTGDLPLIARGCACWAPLMLHPCGRDRSLLRQRRT